jgi:hypothetical protein
MKHLTRLLSLLLLVSAGAFFSNCGGDDDGGTSEEETQLNKLKATWELANVTYEDTPEDRFDGADLKLTITGNFAEGGTYNYSFSTNGAQIDASPFPESGKWKFGSPLTGSIIRLDSQLGTFDDIEMGYTVTETTLTLSFESPAESSFVIGNGRTASVEGTWVFEFTKAN